MCGRNIFSKFVAVKNVIMGSKKAIIIGATSGIGQEVARQLFRDGYTIGIAGRRIERLETLKQELGGSNVFVQQIDVCEEDAAEKMLALIEEMGEVSLIFLASGIGKQNAQLSPDIELATVRTNALGFTRMIGAAYRYFAEHGGGHIAAISSIAGTKGLGAAPAYSATKRFQNTYIQCLAQRARMNGNKITFTDIRPGFVDTDLLAEGGKYPLLMDKAKVAVAIVRAIHRKKRVVTIDWRYRILVFFWRLIPDCVWERMTALSVD